MSPFDALLLRHRVPGGSVAVFDGQGACAVECFGLAEAGGTVPVTPHTQFQAGQISQPVAAYCALRLVEMGYLDLDESVNRTLRSWRLADEAGTAAEHVTLRRLLGHRAGLGPHQLAGYAPGEPLPSTSQILAGRPPAASRPITVQRRPGTAPLPTAAGYVVVQRLVEECTGLPFPAAMQELVLKPLGMADSTFAEPTAGLETPRASGHDGEGESLRGRWRVYPELAASGLWSTPGDLARFALVVWRCAQGTGRMGECGGKLPLASDLARLMMGPAEPAGWSLGFLACGDSSERWFWQGGHSAGYVAWIFLWTKDGRGATVMTNSDAGDALVAELMDAAAARGRWPAWTGIPPWRIRAGAR